VEHAPMPVAVASYPDGRYLLANGAYRRAAAAAGEELLGRCIEEVLPDARASGLVDRRARAVREGATQFVAEFRRATSGGETYWTLAYTPLRNPDGDVDRVLEVWQNVTTQVMAQRHLEAMVAERTRQLEAQQRQLEALVVAGMALAGERSEEGVLRRLSEVACELLHARQATLRVRDTNGGANEFTAVGPSGERSDAPSVRSISQALR